MNIADGASAFAAFCLDVSPGEKVLDMCSSPGGKSIILASQLFRERSTLEGIRDTSSLSTSELVSALKTKLDTSLDESSNTLLVCNEVSSARFKRLVDTIGRFVPQKHISGKHIQFVNYDATSPEKFRRFGKFDKILLDAPCSSERHLIRNGQPWSYKNVKENSKRQLQLLQSAISLLKSGGIILYCTCALDPLENELVIHTILNTLDSVKTLEINYSSVIETLSTRDSEEERNRFKPERRKYGYALMPDKTEYGPLFIAKLQKS
ncbi:conserved hypothetical protein [Theileria equi strain WA]|uniref:NOL1/NOP2/Sun domain family member 4 n=1 Tax=Theileria equi strain WA TaxID=1537102 RepID=L1LEU0_THEEQ|nr:conserved hypothetical protein [Theileria equi strain WA]EKX73861.1 conserved hypothetical protein [Theileria equi strain WA]|eukprot:XP_004833313.1 conserved hypothetical protein [Theileria equi strain WA]